MRKPKFPPGTWVERELFESKAFLSLTGVAPQLLILILGLRDIGKVRIGKKEKMVCRNRDSITFTYIMAKEKYGISKPRFTRAIDDLLAKGFITINHRGGAYQQDKTVYGLSDKWIIWKPNMVMEKREKDLIRRGYQNSKKSKVTHKTVPIHTHETVPIKAVLG